MSTSNRNKCLQYFITLPRWYQLENFSEIANKLPPRKWCYIVQEDHDDDDKNLERNSKIHYHVSIIFKKGISKSNLLKWIKNEWPDDYARIDVQATRSFTNVLDYLKKESIISYEDGERPSKLRDSSSKAMDKAITFLEQAQKKIEADRRWEDWKYWLGTDWMDEASREIADARSWLDHLYNDGPRPYSSPPVSD